MTDATLLDDARLDEMLKGIRLPPQPEVMIALYRQLARPDADLGAIAGIIERDLGLSASVLRTANSPFFGMRRRVDTIASAVMVLGLRNVVNIVSCESLRRSMCDDHMPEIDRFFDHAQEVAFVCASVAREYRAMAPDRGYMLGLFHDCGLPMMLRKFPDYAAFLSGIEPNPDRTIIDLENDRYDTNHAVVGYWLCRAWGLPDDIAEIVAQHHGLGEILPGRTLSAPDREKIPGLAAGLATIALAESVCGVVGTKKGLIVDEPVQDEVLAFFEMGGKEYEIFCDEIRDRLGA